ncbi:hypothetical protein MFU01_74690 [Myxococcus fulvus]|uniref:Uncharacterized protein n=1 Tax=Myxococcus fulvus TaxID=33 RepID=A0A511TGC8_MYXFU|nr:hypothetical protein MFU01_74690 [Myxococcus fulvus]
MDRPLREVLRNHAGVLQAREPQLHHHHEQQGLLATLRVLQGAQQALKGLQGIVGPCTPQGGQGEKPAEIIRVGFVAEQMVAQALLPRRVQVRELQHMQGERCLQDAASGPTAEAAFPLGLEVLEQEADPMRPTRLDVAPVRMSAGSHGASHSHHDRVQAKG